MRDRSSPGKRTPLSAICGLLLGRKVQASYRYEWSQGIRAAVGMSIPIGIALSAGHLSWGILVALATFWTLSCDVGGAYRQKAIALSGSGLAILGAYAFGVWITSSVPMYVIGTFAWSLVAVLLLRLAQATQKAVTSPLAFARLIRANLMHKRDLRALLEPEPVVPINRSQLALSLNAITVPDSRDLVPGMTTKVRLNHLIKSVH
jgi:hypothetical protein